MSVPPPSKRRDEGENDERQCHKREQNVRSEHGKVNRSQPAMIAGRFFTDMEVIDDVAGEKEGRRNDRGDHARDMSLPNIAANPEPPRRNENRADKIKR